jgi:hypothetical protein
MLALVAGFSRVVRGYIEVKEKFSLSVSSRAEPQ